MTADLVAFLREQFADAETMAKEHLCVNCGIPVVPLRSVLGITGYTHDGPTWEGKRCRGSITGAEPIQNPARVLAEVEAKRRIVGLWKKADEEARSDQRYAESYDTSVDGFTAGREAALDDVLRLLAAVYADHPDYRPEWSPDAEEQP